MRHVIRSACCPTRWGRQSAGFVTISALMIMLVVTTMAVLAYTSLLGETQGEVGNQEAVGALAAAEAGANWAVNKLSASGATTYTGDTGQTVSSAGGSSIGVFDVSVTCDDPPTYSTPGVSPNSASGCNTNPTTRIVTATGYVPTKSAALGKRTVVLQVTATGLGFALCAWGPLTFNQQDTVYGNVGSDDSIDHPSISLQGPASSAAAIKAGGGTPGAAYAVTTPQVSCSQSCGTQVAGGVQAKTAGTICPSQTQTKASFTCPVGATNITTSGTTISSNSTWNSVTLGANSTLTFQTAGPGTVLTVHVNGFTVGQGSKVLVTGGGSVVLTVNGVMHINQSSWFGSSSAASWTAVPGSNLTVESCNTSTPAVKFDQSSDFSGYYVVPSGGFEINQAQNAQGAILAASILMDKTSSFTYDSSAGGGSTYNHLVTWLDKP